ncbi:hypothetical protein D5R81_04885 [Parashewanella spongiae]|uniref:Lipoprotein n=1 Tax=Parashewanella spongiae TaxID=342950 RepID=A0A3A6TZH8_9GAMM|nr:hypothetical protein [Parashewanella spongiae]MCL1077268.1 hypothetical protein [Parashewanella spongiae]RJY18550.1 hypothetical protein D5R81_04885 [Parashewanella spongiae]
MRKLSITKIFTLIIIILVVQGCGKKTDENIKPDQNDRSLCQFSVGSCNKKVAGVDFSILINPETIPSEKMLHLTLQTNQKVDAISARVEGRDMFMGVIPVTLKGVDKSHYSSDFILGSCASGYMVWRLFISAEVNGKAVSVFFDFLADNKR